MGEFLNDETYENNIFFYTILEYDRFLPKYRACLARNSLSESTEIVKSSNFNDFNLLPITMTLDFILLIHSLFKLYQLDMLSIQTYNLHSN